jgi:hypothetical protein
MKTPQNHRIDRVKLISLTGEPIRVADVQSAMPTQYAARLLWELCTHNFVLDWAELEACYTMQAIMSIAKEINKQFRLHKADFRLVCDGIQ